MFIARFLLYDIVVHDECLYGQEDLHECAVAGIPHFFGVSAPGVDDGQTDIARVVEIGIEAEQAPAGGLDGHFGGGVGVVRVQFDVEQVEAVLVGGVLRA